MVLEFYASFWGNGFEFLAMRVYFQCFLSAPEVHLFAFCFILRFQEKYMVFSMYEFRLHHVWNGDLLSYACYIQSFIHLHEHIVVF